MDLTLSTSLHSCVCRRNIEIAQLLIRNGVNVSVLNGWGYNPIEYAVCATTSSEVSPGRGRRHFPNLQVRSNDTIHSKHVWDQFDHATSVESRGSSHHSKRWIHTTAFCGRSRNRGNIATHFGRRCEYRIERQWRSNRATPRDAPYISILRVSS
jgi:hypothetical protein